MGDITQLLQEMNEDSPLAGEELLEIVYQELRLIAAQKMKREAPGQTLDPTGLVHEAFLRLFHTNATPSWENRRHFFCAAAEVMRRILIDNARRKKRIKRGGHVQREEVDLTMIAFPDPDEQIEGISESLDLLARREPRIAELVKLRYFVGMTLKDTAELLEISLRTANTWWAYARAWLKTELHNRPG